jgi:3-methyladenine DNA glycosylase Tag
MSPAPGWTPAKPDSLSGYLEALSRPIFSTGMSWRVIDAKWDGVRQAFAGFDPEKVAALSPADVDRLAEDTRVIRNRRKIEAIVGNAQRMIDLDRDYDGFRRYLESRGSFDATVADLRREFRFLGESGAYIFLWSVDEPVPSHEQWAAAHGKHAA